MQKNGQEPRQVPGKKGGVLAGILSILCPGLGQLYNGSLKRALWAPGLIIVIGILLRSPLTLWGGAAAVYFFYLSSFAIWGWSVWEAASKPKSKIVPARAGRIAAYLGYYIGMMALFVVVNLLTKQYGSTEVFHIPANSMSPSVLSGDYVVVDKWAFRNRPPVPGDVTVFRYPRDNSINYIKRVIALEGQSVQVMGSGLLVDGKKIERIAESNPNLMEEVGAAGDEKSFSLFSEKVGERSHLIFINKSSSPNMDFGPATIPENHFFVLGDHRNRSSDSRIWGNVSFNDLVGKAEFIYFSRSPFTGRIRWERIGQKIR